MSLFALKPRTATQLRQLLDDGGETGGRATTGAAARGVTWVKVTGPVVSGWYPAIVSLDTAGEWEDLDAAVKVAPSAEDGELVEDVRYLCTRAGDDVDGTARFRTCASLPEDLKVVRTTIEVLVNHTWIALVAGKLRQTEKRTDYVNYFNEADELVYRTAGVPYEDYTEVDLCGLYDCCSAAELGVEVDVTNPDACGFAFAATLTGGTGPFTYDWQFGDGAHADTANPTHNYTAAGSWNWTLTVRDACGKEARAEGTAVCESPDPPGPGPGPYCDAYTVLGVVLTRDGPGLESWSGGGWQLTHAPSWQLTYRVGSEFCVYIPWVAGGNWDGSGCVGWLRVHNSPGNPLGCALHLASDSVCCGGEPVTNDCCGSDPVPGGLFLTLSGGTGGHAALNGLTVPLTYVAAPVDCNGTSTPDPGWYGTFSAGGIDFYCLFKCIAGTWSLVGSNCVVSPAVPTCGFINTLADPGGTCAPDFAASGTGLMMPCLGAGSVDWLVTSTAP